MSRATRLAITQPRTSRWPGDDPDCNRRHRHRGKHIPTVEGIGGLQIWLAPFRPELRTREVFQQLKLDLRSGFRVETACESVIGRADQAGMDTLVGNTESGHPGGEARIEFGRCQSGHGHQRSTETLDTSKLISAFPCEPSISPGQLIKFIALSNVLFLFLIQSGIEISVRSRFLRRSAHASAHGGRGRALGKRRRLSGSDVWRIARQRCTRGGAVRSLPSAIVSRLLECRPGGAHARIGAVCLCQVRRRGPYAFRTAQADVAETASTAGV
jgi:hypothetical protein